MSSIKEYFSSVGKGVKSLVTGMGVTGKEFVTPKITECYPENRATLQIPERFRAELTLKYDNEGRHKCIACGICQMNCPNGTISLTKKMVELPTSLAPHERLTDLAVVPREKPHTGAAPREQPRDSPVIER